jgi:hypothetical protein
MTALVLELCGGVCALSTINFLAMLMVRKLEEELGPDLARSQAESFVAHLRAIRLLHPAAADPEARRGR